MWRSSDGSSVLFWDNYWLPNVPNLRDHDVVPLCMRASYFISMNGECNVDILVNLFPRDIVNSG